MKISFVDEENIYGMIETEEDLEIVEELLEEFRKDKTEYDIDAFYEYLRTNDVEFEELPVEADHEVIF